MQLFGRTPRDPLPEVRNSGHVDFLWPRPRARRRYALPSMNSLPAPLLEDGVTAAQKLAYLWVRANPGEHSARSLRAALGVRMDGVLPSLTEMGLLIEEQPPAGSVSGKYRAAPSKVGRKTNK
jgi:hypothetical protein